MDAVRVAVRNRSKEVFILYRRTRAEMPARRKKSKKRWKKGIEMKFLVARNVVGKKMEKVTGIEASYGTG